MVSGIPEIEKMIEGAKEVGIDAFTRSGVELCDTLRDLVRGGCQRAVPILEAAQSILASAYANGQAFREEHPVLYSVQTRLGTLLTVAESSVMEASAALVSLKRAITWITYLAAAYRIYSWTSSRLAQPDIGRLHTVALQQQMPFIQAIIDGAPARAAMLMLKARSTEDGARARQLCAPDTDMKMFYYDEDRGIDYPIWDCFWELLSLGVAGSHLFIRGVHVNSTFNEAFEAAENHLPFMQEKGRKTFNCFLIADFKGPMAPSSRNLPPFNVGPRVHENGFAIFGTSTHDTLCYSLDLRSTVLRAGFAKAPLVDHVCHNYLRDVRWYGAGRGGGFVDGLWRWAAGVPGILTGAVAEGAIIHAAQHGAVIAITGKCVAYKVGYAVCAVSGGVVSAGAALTYDQYNRHWQKQHHDTQSMCTRFGPCH